MILATLLLAAGGYGQVALSIIQDSSSITPTTVNENDPLSYSLLVANLDSTQQFNGSLEIWVKANNNAPFIAYTDTVVVAQSGFATITFADLAVISSAKFDGGVNVVIVWPDSPSNPTAVDTFMTNITVNPAMQFASKVDSKSFADIYPLPAKDLLQVRFMVPIASSLDFLLTNEHGQVVLNTSASIGETELQINLQGIRPGIYILRWEGREERGTRKIVVE